MIDMDKLEQRVMELETQLAFQQDTIDNLNEIVTKQWSMMENQQKQIKHMDDQIYAIETQTGTAGAPQQERPPHY